MPITLRQGFLDVTVGASEKVGASEQGAAVVSLTTETKPGVVFHVSRVPVVDLFVLHGFFSGYSGFRPPPKSTHNRYCYIASAETKRDWLIHGHLALNKCNVSLGQ